MSLQFRRNRGRTLNPTSGMSQIECGHPGRFLLNVISKIFQEVIDKARQHENTVHPVIGLGFHSFSDQERRPRLWLSLVNKVRQQADSFLSLFIQCQDNTSNDPFSRVKSVQEYDYR